MCIRDSLWVNRYGQTWPVELEPPLVEIVDLYGLARWLRGQAVGQGRGQGSDEGGRQGAGYGSTEEMK